MPHILTLPRAVVPPSLDTPLFALERQTLEHADADYRAVMSAKEHLRQWSASEWPEDSFTLEENREDLAGHIADAAIGSAFGYTVFDRSRGTVLGSVYFYSIDIFTPRYDLDDSQRKAISEALVLIDYWLLPDLEAGPEHMLFLDHLTRWMREEWGFASGVWATRPLMEDRRHIYDARGWKHLVHAHSITSPGWSMHFHLG